MAHRQLIGQSGTGKTTLMKEWLLDDIHTGHAVCYIDPHGTDTDDLLQYIPRARRQDVIVFDPTQFAIPWNPLRSDNVPLTASMFVNSFRSVWGYDQMSTPRMDGMVYNLLVALIEARQGLFGMWLMFVSDKYRKHVIEGILDPVVQRYWQDYDLLPDKQRLEQSESTFNKVQILMADPRVRAICGTRSAFDIEDLIRDKILFIRLPQGELGIEKTAVLGSLLLAQIHQACLRRDTATPFHLYVDEVHTFAESSIREMLSGVRKFNVELTVVHQYLGQLGEQFRASVKANTDQYVFKVSTEDSEHFGGVGGTNIQPHELEPYHAWVFDRVKPCMIHTQPLSYAPYSASARQIRAHHVRHLVRPADREIDALLTKYS